MSINRYPEKDQLENRTTAFGEVYANDLTPVIHLDFPYNINSRIVTDRSGGGGSLVQVSGMAVCSTSASTNASGVLQSRASLRYNPGLGGLARFSAIFTTGVDGSSQQIGVGDEFDGYFFGYDGSSFGILHKKDGEEEWATQANWNLNTMDNLDATLGNVYQISYKLGFGRVIFSIEDPDTGEYQKVHQFEHANENLEPAILNTNLPLCIFAGNTTNTSNISLSTFSMGGFIEGKDDETGVIYSSGVSKSLGATEIPLMAFRNNITFQGKSNRSLVQLIRAFAGNEGNQTIELRFLLNPTLTGANFIEVDSNTSVMSTDINTTSIVNGIEIIRGLVGGVSSDTFDLTTFEFLMDAGDIVLITGRRLSGATADVSVGMIWTEKT